MRSDLRLPKTHKRSAPLFIADQEAMDTERVKARELRQSRWWKQKLQNATCYHCHKPLKPAEVTMDHLLPILRGGKSTKDNCVIACKPCNSAKKEELAF